jgi:hypothetical protein
MDPDFRQVKRPEKSVAVVEKNTVTETPKETFKSPDTVSANDSLSTNQAVGKHLTFEPKTTTKHSWRDKLSDFFTEHRREWIASVVIVLVCGSLSGFILIKSSKKPVASAAKPVSHKVAPLPAIVPSTLSGLPVAPDVNKRPVTGVMIENSQQARPQSGLSQASVVFEAIAEGGITRFLALFQDQLPDNVGPIRSARPYFEQWALGFDAGYAHVGGSPEALQAIKDWGVRDLDQFYNSGSYHRIPSRDAPHNVYTSLAALNQLEVSKGYAASNFTGFGRKKEAPATVTARAINLAISGALYNVHYDYNAPTNSYNRSEGGGAHSDANTNTQLSPKVVVAMVMPYSLEADGYHSNYGTLGGGQVFIFQDGTVTTGQWSKPDNKTQFSFTDASGKPIKLNPGQTWLTAVRAAANVTYTP